MAIRRLLLGLDIGSSSIKASLIDSDTRQPLATAQSPNEEMPMLAVQPGWAEQEPEMWWKHAVLSFRQCLEKAQARAGEVVSVGISYQMHGLVVVGKDHKPLRPSIIWCDSRAVGIGEKAFQQLGKDYCLTHFLNSPGNFTASKLRWVKENEPAVFQKIHKAMLPGDYIALKLTGEICTTHSGLSEGIFWDYKSSSVSDVLLKHYEIDKDMIAKEAHVFSVQGKIRPETAGELGLSSETTVAYRAGDQPNNAFSLNVNQPGEIAATAGTSGVIYACTDQDAFDVKSRVNTFVHVNDAPRAKRNGVLLCINGTGILNSWLRKNVRSGTVYDYDHINEIASKAPIGSAGVSTLPFGNGSERVFENKILNASLHGLDFNRHDQSHLFRSAQEGIVFALNYGFEILKEMGCHAKVIRAGKANMFLSRLFREAFVNTTGADLELYNTDGATGAALGAGIGSGVFANFKEAFSGLNLLQAEHPQKALVQQYQAAYQQWKKNLNNQS